MSKIDCGSNWIACPSYIGNTAGASTPVNVSCAYVTEDSLIIYVAEDGVTIYQPEDCGPSLDFSKPGNSQYINIFGMP
jgi:hypothetical protein